MNRYNKDTNNKVVAFTAETPAVNEQANENQDKGIAVITRGVRKILKQRRQRPQQEFKSNDFKRNDDRCYYCEELRHIKQNCPKRRRRNN